MSDPGPARPFRTLEPPRGGLAGLRARIERDGLRRRRVRRLQLVGAAAAVVLAVVALLVPAPAEGPRPDPLADQLRQTRMRLGIVEAPQEVLTVRADKRGVMAAERVPLENDRVVFYMIASLEPVADR